MFFSLKFLILEKKKENITTLGLNIRRVKRIGRRAYFAIFLHKLRMSNAKRHRFFPVAER